MQMETTLPDALTSSLNGQQKQAVEVTRGPLLVLAGAGSGKTRILTLRIARLILEGLALPGEIFAVTFTNKAAKEMKGRVERFLQTSNIPIHDLWISTFHSSGAKLMRQYAPLVGLDPSFSIFDDGDSQSIIKEAMSELAIGEKVLNPKTIHYQIQQLKNEGQDPALFQAGHDFLMRRMEPVIHLYEKKLRQHNAIDFGDLLLKTYFLFRDNPDVLERFQEQYRYILVDEYQDTNRVQYLLLSLLAGKHRNICVVGDEDQSIYKWRGADIRNILDFEKEYPDAQVVKLEENYRSTGHIIRAASRVISYNTQRKEKNLFTNNLDGDPIEVHHLESDFEEARWVVRKISSVLNDEGHSAEDVALFYRTHAQSRLFEDMLRAERLPYRIFGGLKFYERAEIKDAIAYLRLLANSQDDLSLTRIINVPARGIGKSSVDQLKEVARAQGKPMLATLRDAVEGHIEIPGPLRKKLGTFYGLLEKLRSKVNEFELRDYYSWMLEETGYLKSLEAENSQESIARLENLKELASAIGDYETRVEKPTLQGFLEEISLYTDMDRSDASASAVTMMTIHSAKGLEYPVVFLVGLEEELFPSLRGGSLEGLNEEEVEEERRLCYVGMTRAEERLFLTRAHVRRVFGAKKIRQPSRFLGELPKDEIMVTDHAPRTLTSNWAFRADGQRTAREEGDSGWSKSSGFEDYFETGSPALGNESPVGIQPTVDGFNVGTRVRHPDYGDGLVMKREGNKDQLKLTIRFQRSGMKKFLAKYAPLQKLD
jgi:DNA helicase-2/ATP-dependent DNA helicase PcrA